MSIFSGVNNPGIDIDELTLAEEVFVQNLAGLSYVSGDIIYHDGTNLTRLAKGSDGEVLTLASGIPSWAADFSVSFADSETPTGAIDGSNAAFVCAYTPSPVASLQVFLNGAYQTAGGEDYTLATATFTFVTAPPTGSILRIFYRH